MNSKLTIPFSLAIAVLGLSCGCNQQRDVPDDRPPIPSSAAVKTTNDTLRVNQPRALLQTETVVAKGTNIVLAEASGASKAGPDGALATRVKTALQNDTVLTPLMDRIHIEGRNGKIILSGVVQTEAQMQSLLEKVRETVGKDNVVNQLQVQSTPDLTPAPNVPKPINQ